MSGLLPAGANSTCTKTPHPQMITDDAAHIEGSSRRPDKSSNMSGWKLLC